ncbi:MAG: hypothetical protein Q8L85_00345 [Alphaproteobacteria bacterium]|nr:hypothetical protein [Alphaproteobacteria bacterium]
MKNKAFYFICAIILNTPCFGMTEDNSEGDTEDDVKLLTESVEVAGSPSPKISEPLRPNRHSSTKIDASWISQSSSAPSLRSNQKLEQKGRRGSVHLKYVNNLEFSQSNPSLSNITKPEVGSLEESQHSKVMPKLVRAHSGMLTIEDHITREHLDADVLAEDIFLLTQLINNRLMLALADPRLETYVDALKVLQQRVFIGYGKAYEFAQQTQKTMPSYYQDYAQIYSDTESVIQPNLAFVQFMKSLLIAEELKNEARFELESEFLKRFSEDAINDEIPNRPLFLKTIKELIFKPFESVMDKYPYMHIYGEVASKNFYIKQFLTYCKSLIEERLKEKKKETLPSLKKRLSFNVSTMPSEKLRKMTSHFNLVAETPSVLIAKEKESYLAPIKDYLEGIIYAIDYEIASLKEPESSLMTEISLVERNEIESYFLDYWAQPPRKFKPNDFKDQEADAEKLMSTLTKIVEVYEEVLAQKDQISYDPLHMFNLFYKEINPYWAEYNFYTHFTDNMAYIGDKKDAFNPFGFLPLDEYECRFLAENHCGRGKLKGARDYLK